MAEISSTYAGIMPTVKFTQNKQKTTKEEVKEIIQNPDDPLAKYPLRAFGYSNEVGAAVSTMPVWGQAAEKLLWVPALMYLGADIYDKYKKGKEGNYSDASVTKAVEQATFQGLASVLLPTAAVKMGQSAAGYFTKFDGTHLTASSKEELYKKLLGDFEKGKFAKCDIIEGDKVVLSGFDRVKDKVLNSDFDERLTSTRQDLKSEKWYSWNKVKRFFAHSDRPISSAKANETDVKNFVAEKAKDIFNTQNILEAGEKDDILNSGNNKLIKMYKKASKNIESRVENILKSNPSFVLKKILNSNDKKYAHLKEMILNKYPEREKLKVLVRDKKASLDMLNELIKTPSNEKIVKIFTEKAEIAREVLRKYIKGKEGKLGLLKTAGGFAALALLAVPIDHFVHKYIIKMFVGPGLEEVEKLHSKLSFKQGEKNSQNNVVKTK